jgi:hypothetical protein
LSQRKIKTKSLTSRSIIPVMFILKSRNKYPTRGNWSNKWWHSCITDVWKIMAECFMGWKNCHQCIKWKF